MRPRFVGRLGLADAVTSANAALGFLAVVATHFDVTLAARLILLAAVGDALDGIVARRWGSTPVGEHLDSLADVAAFGVAPALLVVVLVVRGDPSHPAFLLGVGVPALFVVMAVVRLGLYTAYDVENAHTEGVQTTLAATVLATGVLAGAPPVAVLAVTALLCYLMVARVTYPDLHVRDALVMGVVQVAAILAPTAFGGLFPKGLLVWALAYLLFAPWLYWRE